MKATIELIGASKDTLEHFKKMNSNILSVTVSTCGDYTQIVAKGSYDALLDIILKATEYKNYTVKLQ